MVMEVPSLQTVLMEVVMVAPKRKSSVLWLEGIVPLSTVTADNNPHSEVLSGGNFDVPKEGYPAPYVPEDFQGLFIPKLGAPDILTCGYHHTSL